ncbi:MAG: L-serine ammonia-lyase, iron-sulfur-dependent, subunit alpha, partial [Rhodothermaceae bacterium]
MESIKEIFKIGYGPSSSHTMGPRKAAEEFLAKNSDADKFEVTLFGSLAATGKGHLTDTAIEQVFREKKIEIIWKPEIFLDKHPNAMTIKAVKGDAVVNEWTAYSIGGGDVIDESSTIEREQIYDLSTMKDILEWVDKRGKHFWEYVDHCENSDVWDYLLEVWKVMENAVETGIEEEGTLPGIINLPRKASTYFIKAQGLKKSLKSRSLVFAYALAVAEENAGGGKVVTAPTCGSCGVVPAVLYHIKKSYDFSERKIIRALATAGLIGNLVKTNASISGAEVGCQGEVGTACSMASGAVLQLFGGTPSQIEYAAEMGLEHHLGLTCDPIAGLVPIVFFEMVELETSRALDANNYAV